MKRYWTIQIGFLLGAVLLAAGCESEAEPRTTEDFLADTVAMDSKLLICREDRRAAARDPECKAARLAASRVAAIKEAAEREENEEQSQAEVDRLRDIQDSRDEAARQRQAQLVRTAESKLEQGLKLTPEEARAIGIDPESSVLVDND